MIIKTCTICKKEFRAKRNSQKFCSKTCAQHDPSVLDKMRKSQNKTFNEKYGGHPMKTNTETVIRFKKSLFENHGEDYFTNYLVNETKKTKKEKYGNENYNNIEKNKQTCLEKYGVDNVFKSKNILEKRSKNVMTKHYNDLITLCQNENLEFLCNKEEYEGYHFSNVYNFKCLKCGYIFQNTVYNLEHLFCEKCDPNRKNTLENQIFDFLTSILQNKEIIIRRDRTLLHGKELDFYIPSKKLAIELNGLYWHSEIGGNVSKMYHLYKSKSCIFYGVRLIHIFESEWVYKRKIVESIIKNILGLIDIKIYARKCKIKEINVLEKNNFLEYNHIQGTDASNIRLGLFYNNELMSVMTFCKSRFDKKIEYEMSRFCNKINTNIIGGASKLFSHFVNYYLPKSVVSYSDKRYFSGKVYHQLGFSFVKATSPNYHYIINKYKTLCNRMSFQKHKLPKLLEKFELSLSEWENMKNNGFDRIWDCGNDKWIIKLNYN